MIRLDEETSIKIERAAVESLEKYRESWKALTHQQILDLKEKNLELIENFNGLEIERILESEIANDFWKFCVQLSVCQTLLNNEECPTGGPHKLL